MINEIIVEMAIEGHASTRDAIRWAIAQEREACAKVCENVVSNEGYVQSKWCVDAIRARGQA